MTPACLSRCARASLCGGEVTRMTSVTDGRARQKISGVKRLVSQGRRVSQPDVAASLRRWGNDSRRCVSLCAVARRESGSECAHV